MGEGEYWLYCSSIGEGGRIFVGLCGQEEVGRRSLICAKQEEAE